MSLWQPESANDLRDDVARHVLALLPIQGEVVPPEQNSCCQMTKGLTPWDHPEQDHGALQRGFPVADLVVGARWIPCVLSVARATKSDECLALLHGGKHGVRDTLPCRRVDNVEVHQLLRQRLLQHEGLGLRKPVWEPQRCEDLASPLAAPRRGWERHGIRGLLHLVLDPRLGRGGSEHRHGVPELAAVLAVHVEVPHLGMLDAAKVPPGEGLHLGPRVMVCLPENGLELQPWRWWRDIGGLEEGAQEMVDPRLRVVSPLSRCCSP
mmetsp:Transcript_30228/g.88028  ORF Transcript_30228/g.88028 Transcript_30228/m.88028 type:complete len:266 (-) Transcript_30228:544-1341(-)